MLLCTSKFVKIFGAKGVLHDASSGAFSGDAQQHCKSSEGKHSGTEVLLNLSPKMDKSAQAQGTVEQVIFTHY